MPHLPLVVSDGVHIDPVRVLITGFGPFANYNINPSWLAVRKLHNVLLEHTSLVQPISVDNVQILSDAKDVKPIHITALEVPVSYSAVLSIVPNIHTRPPVLPTPASGDEEPTSLAFGPDPPANGYDLVLHVGVGLEGNLRVEKLAHKFGYVKPDVDGKYAPEVSEQAGDGAKDEYARSNGDFAEDIKAPTSRGFGKGYDAFAEEVETPIDVDKLVSDLRESTIDQMEKSTDPGRYLCDFIYYCSLAEAERTATSSPSGKPTKVLFVHCPPINRPLTTEYVTEALKRIILSVGRQC